MDSIKGDGNVKLVSLTNDQFEKFASTHPLNNYMQTYKYALVMTDAGYDYDFMGYEDDNSNIVAASLILSKSITGKVKYGYAPKGFLINYYDEVLLKSFLRDLVIYYKDKNFVFIKFNPEIITGQTDINHKYQMAYNGNVRIIDALKSMSVKRRMELREFDLMEPKFNAYINLKTFSINSVNRNFRKKVRKCIKSGMSLVSGDVKSMDKLYSFISMKTNKNIQYYRTLFNVYNRDNSIDLLYVNMNFETALLFARDKYEKEQVKNDEWNNIIQSKPTPRNLNAKMNSDKKLAAYKDLVIKATDGLKAHKETIIAGAIVIKHYNRVSIITSGYDEQYKFLNPNHFLYYAIFERYKPYFSFCDLHGVSGNFEHTSQYNGLNQFKLKWNPVIYEFIGEFDLIINNSTFKRLIKTSFIEDEFNKKRSF
ncbi:MAG TPA: peptidoglycan bridge formation glycyltransferase FemA/FemB family protein [Bacilli bacterium]|jgi:lipid II:glycine glycyltransferase (peptidoglycan interpeptide bridge formation enzyme)|nr:peptidoglycan bridge formation glycyltransferase FemA/FemB family protein [Bacilli bacterium]HPZ23364.1 peptidoglycan bridge formation glycyltransferase FemA/FemB family protein [Bacilli bacterium]